MIRKNTIFDYLTHVMVVWSISMLSLCLFCFLFGQEAKGHSSIFALGNEGLSLATMMQFFVLAIITTGLRWIFFTHILVKRLSIMVRSIFMFTGVIVSVGIFAAVFGWFPVDQILPWGMFFLCFFVCAAVSVAVSVMKEKSDNRKLQEALERMKGEGHS